MASIKHVFVFEYSTVCANIHQISNLKYQGASLMKAFELPANGRAQAEEEYAREKEGRLGGGTGRYCR